MVVVVITYLNSLVVWLDDVHRCKILLIKFKNFHSIVGSVSSCNNEETSEAKIIFQDHGFFYQLLIKHGKISYVRPVAKKETN